jgi:hypothetical protein
MPVTSNHNQRQAPISLSLVENSSDRRVKRDVTGYFFEASLDGEVASDRLVKKPVTRHTPVFRARILLVRFFPARHLHGLAFPALVTWPAGPHGSSTVGQSIDQEAAVELPRTIPRAVPAKNYRHRLVSVPECRASSRNSRESWRPRIRPGVALDYRSQ